MPKRATMDCSVEEILWALGIPEGVVLETTGVPPPFSGIGKTLRLHLVGDGLPEAYRVAEDGAVRNMPVPAPRECIAEPRPKAEGKHSKLRAAIAAWKETQDVEYTAERAVEAAHEASAEKEVAVALILHEDYSDARVVVDGQEFRRCDGNRVVCTMTLAETGRVLVFIPSEEGVVSCAATVTMYGTTYYLPYDGHTIRNTTGITIPEGVPIYVDGRGPVIRGPAVAPGACIRC